MAYSAAKNQVFHQRLQNYAVAMQNLREEGARLRDWYFAEINVSNVVDEAFVDTPIATTDECINLLSFMEDFRRLIENEAVGQGWRNGWLIPFLPNDAQV